MSRINQKTNWQISTGESDYAIPEDSTKGKKVEMISNNEVQQNQSVNSGQEVGLDVNLIISSFQERLAQLTIEMVIKDATIKQLTNIINNIKGKS